MKYIPKTDVIPYISEDYNEIEKNFSFAARHHHDDCGLYRLQTDSEVPICQR
jgi:hypothetical protein